MKAMITMLVIAVLGLLWLRHENGNLRSSFDKANRVANQQKTTIGMLKNQLSVAAIRADPGNKRAGAGREREKLCRRSARSAAGKNDCEATQ
ncbi:hypothetical protein Q8W43_20580 [Klebsiella pneumoniae]|nr:hypothetical protein Q8W43_20580 [Klebsiella pneumoniae]